MAFLDFKKNDGKVKRGKLNFGVVTIFDDFAFIYRYRLIIIAVRLVNFVTITYLCVVILL